LKNNEKGPKTKNQNKEGCKTKWETPRKGGQSIILKNQEKTNNFPKAFCNNQKVKILRIRSCTFCQLILKEIGGIKHHNMNSRALGALSKFGLLYSPMFFYNPPLVHNHSGKIAPNSVPKR